MIHIIKYTHSKFNPIKWSAAANIYRGKTKYCSGVYPGSIFGLYFVDQSFPTHIFVERISSVITLHQDSENTWSPPRYLHWQIVGTPKWHFLLTQFVLSLSLRKEKKKSRWKAFSRISLSTHKTDYRTRIDMHNLRIVTLWAFLSILK